ncbi:MAG: phosphoribosyltransferase [Nitrososphaerota archaeon]
MEHLGREVEFEGNKFLVLTWEDIMSHVESLAEKIKESYAFDAIIGILRGGLFVANLLSDILGIDEVHPLGIRSYTDIEHRGEVKIYHWPSLPLMTGKKLLIVDDVSDEGKTLRAAVEKVVKPLGALTIKTAVLHVKPWTSFMPDYHVVTTSCWILYPWSRYESVRHLGKRLVNKMGIDGASRALSTLLSLDYERVINTLKESS